ncbi:bifunctional metallophosphatase/5'-nucleotidase [Sunxiuqinia indica]|uniref:bifunctional metallophosphatase/5'-nucleotidase n=1 Tax=Sunxiuqinia indica TaxID=2692584 RepID=UPI00135A2440|nr:metallophosphatase [Sunxiuqinia indica]
MNSRRKFLRDLAGVSAGVGLSALPYDLLAKQDLESLTILHTNDIHCHIDPFPEDNSTYRGRGGLARMAGMINRIKEANDNVLLLDAGDMFQGTPYFNYYKGELILKVMSEMGYDASTIGNHEFDNGLEGIENSIDFANFPFVCSNYDFSNTRLFNVFPEFTVFRKSGIKVGVYGLGIELEGLVSERNYQETIYRDPVKIALEKEDFLKHEKGCDVVICLSHLGLEYTESKISDKLLAAETHHTDLIIGGHTHTFLDAPLELRNADGNRIIVNQAGWGGMALGRIDFIFDRNRNTKEAILTQNSLTDL